MIKAVLFDLDGTLINTNDLILDSFKYTYKTVLNKYINDDEIIASFGKPLNITFSYYDKDRVDELTNVYIEYNRANHDKKCKVFDNVKDLIEELKRNNIKIGIVTSKREAMAKRGLEINDLLKDMDVIMTPEKTKKHKPDAEPVIEACKELGIKTKEAIMVGDSNYDILSGNKAGCYTIAVDYSILSKSEINKAKPNFWISNPMEIINIVNELNRG